VLGYKFNYISKDVIGMSITTVIDFPEEILLTLRESKETFTKELKVMAAIQYYNDKKLSIGQAAQLAEMTEEQMILYLSEKRISVFRYDNEDELIEDVKNA